MVTREARSADLVVIGQAKEPKGGQANSTRSTLARRF
jgi:hypothetical protein